ncbi:UNVERIFIED_ORG: hypothetical protein CLV66_102188 [Actinomadura viridilutea]
MTTESAHRSAKSDRSKGDHSSWTRVSPRLPAPGATTAREHDQKSRSPTPVAHLTRAPARSPTSSAASARPTQSRRSLADSGSAGARSGPPTRQASRRGCGSRRPSANPAGTASPTCARSSKEAPADGRREPQGTPVCRCADVSAGRRSGASGHRSDRRSNQTGDAPARPLPNHPTSPTSHCADSAPPRCRPSAPAARTDAQARAAQSTPRAPSARRRRTLGGRPLPQARRNHRQTARRPQRPDHASSSPSASSPTASTPPKPSPRSSPPSRRSARSGTTAPR